jgi:hypothetical protein
VVRDAREHIEASAVARDRLGEQFAGDAGERDAVAAEALQEVDLGLEPAEVRRAVHRDVHVAAPGVVDGGVRELREHLQHARAGGATGAERVEPGIAHAPAEEQAVVGRAPEVVDHPVDIRDRSVVADERGGALGAERFGRDDVGADAHDLARERGRKRPEPGVAAERERPAAHAACGGRDLEAA